MVEGMHCANCVKGLNDVLTEDLEGVEVLEISLEGKYADIDAADSVSDDQLKAAVHPESGSDAFVEITTILLYEYTA